MQYSFNLHTPLIVHPQTDILVHASQAEAQPVLPNRNYSINGLNRWHLALSSYRSIEECITCMERWHRWNYKKSKQKFDAHGCTIKIIQNDWSEHAQTVNRLYLNVAQHYHHWIYDQHFFTEAAKRSDYSLLTAWYKKEMIGVFVLQEEPPILHSTCCGLNYEHSTPSYAYSWMHYALIDHTISQRKFNMVNVGPYRSNPCKKEEIDKVTTTKMGMMRFITGPKSKLAITVTTKKTAIKNHRSFSILPLGVVA